MRKAVIKCSTVKGQESALEESPFAGYAAFSTPVQRCSSHQYLAIRRAESQGLLKVKFVLPRDDNTAEAIADMFVSEKANSDCAKCITMAVEDAYKRLLLPAAETDISAELKEKADTVAIDIFADTLRQLLLAPLCSASECSLSTPVSDRVAKWRLSMHKATYSTTV